MKTMNFLDDIASLPFEDFKNHYVLVLDLTSIQDAIESNHYLELVGEPLRPELNFTFPLEHITELIVLGGWERIFSIAVDKFDVVVKNLKCILILSSKYSTVSQYSSIGTAVQFPLTIFPLLTMTPWPF